MTALIQDRIDALYDLCRKYDLVELSLFGSAVDVSFDASQSELDFLVRFPQGTPHDHRLRYFGLLADLQDLFGREIDLVEPQTIKNPYLAKEVESSLSPFYGTPTIRISS